MGRRSRLDYSKLPENTFKGDFRTKQFSDMTLGEASVVCREQGLSYGQMQAKMYAESSRRERC